jgi:hypothetical protein
MATHVLTAWAVDHESTVEKTVAVKQVCRAPSRPIKLSLASHTTLMPDKEHAVKPRMAFGVGEVSVEISDFQVWKH